MLNDMPEQIQKTEIESRNGRQKAVIEWGDRELLLGENAPPVRARRFLEEALELFQALGGSPEEATRIAAHVFGRPPGDPRQEFGGVATTLMALAEVNGLSIAEMEIVEFTRITSKPPGYFLNRNREKLAAGL